MNTRYPLIGLLVGLTLTLAACSDDSSDAAGIHSTPEIESPSVEPMAAEDPLAAARRVHDAVLVIDAHADIELPGKPSPYVGPDGVSRVAPDKLSAGGVDAVVMAVAVLLPVQRLPWQMVR